LGGSSQSDQPAILGVARWLGRLNLLHETSAGGRAYALTRMEAPFVGDPSAPTHHLNGCYPFRSLSAALTWRRLCKRHRIVESLSKQIAFRS
jgi:hypothetical protein